MQEMYTEGSQMFKVYHWQVHFFILLIFIYIISIYGCSIDTMVW